MFRKIKTNQKGLASLSQSGLTYIELLVAIGIIAILSALSMFYIKTNTREDVRRATEQLAADIRLARNMAISRTITSFGDGTTEYPEDGYGIYFRDSDVSGQVSYYILYAGRGNDGFDGGSSNGGDKIIKKVDLPKSNLKINDVNSFAAQGYFAFYTENSISTSLGKDMLSRYIIEILDPCVVTNTNGTCLSGYRGVINLGEKSGDQYTMSNVGVSYNTVNLPLPPTPPPEPRGAKGLSPALGGDNPGGDNPSGL